MIDNPQVVTFCNEGLRPAADKLVAALLAARNLIAVYDSTGVAALLGDDPTFSNIISDGSQSDGRPQISAGGVKLTMENIRGLLAQLDSTETPTGLSLAQGVMSISPRYGG